MRRLAALAALLALAASGCASTDAKLHRALRAERAETLTIITRAELDAQPPGSPARAVLALWRAVQFRDAEGAIARVSPQPSPKELRTFEDFIVDIGANTAVVTKPTVIRSQQSGRNATVEVEFVRHKRVGDKIRTNVTGRLRVDLARKHGDWLVLWRRLTDGITQAIS